MTRLLKVVRDHLRKIGRKGGLAAADNMTRAERVERARKAGSAPKQKRKVRRTRMNTGRNKS